MTDILFVATTHLRGERDHTGLLGLGATFLSEDRLTGVQLMLSQRRYAPVVVEAHPGAVLGEAYAIPWQQLALIQRTAESAGLVLAYRLFESGRYAHVLMEPVIDPSADLVIGPSFRTWTERERWYQYAAEVARRQRVMFDTGVLHQSFTFTV